ncbi:MAG TPA: hypothetical protein VF114_01850 [Candidatus Limnocylindria bacterium]
MVVASGVALVVLGLLAVFQLALVAGAPLGRFAWGGQHTVLPTRLRIGSVVSILIYAVFAALLLSKSGLWRVVTSEKVLDIGLWVTSGYLCLGVLMNGISRSKPERNVMTPVAAVLAGCFFVAAVS